MRILPWREKGSTTKNLRREDHSAHDLCSPRSLALTQGKLPQLRTWSQSEYCRETYTACGTWTGHLARRTRAAVRADGHSQRGPDAIQQRSLMRGVVDLLIAVKRGGLFPHRLQQKSWPHRCSGSRTARRGRRRGCAANDRRHPQRARGHVDVRVCSGQASNFARDVAAWLRSRHTYMGQSITDEGALIGSSRRE